MSLHDFWINVRRASRLPASSHIVDSPRFDAATIERMLREENAWLTPRSVAGYAEADFSFLPEQERRQLTRLVEGFRQIASQVPWGTPPTREQVESALPLFRDLIATLAFDRYGDAEAYQIGKQIENRIEGVRPPDLVELRFATGADHSGDPVLRVWAILAEEVPGDDEHFFQQTKRVRDLLDAAAREIVPQRWPYVRFRSADEQAEIMEAQAS